MTEYVTPDDFRKVLSSIIFRDLRDRFRALPVDEQQQLIEQYYCLLDDFGPNAPEVLEFVHRQSMKLSITYYVVHIFTADDSEWDKGLRDELGD